MTFEVNGTDIMPFAAVGGVSWKRVNVEGSNSMIMQDGTKIADRIAARYEWSFKFRPMTADEQATILTLLSPRSVTVRFTDPERNVFATADYYVSDVPSGYLLRRSNGVEYWGGLAASFSSRPGLSSS